MQLEIRSKNVRLDRELREHIDRRVRFALDHVWDDIRNVVVQLTDVNGPRGRVDQRCAVMVRLIDGGSRIVRDDRETPHAAVSRAVSRITRRIEKRLDRRRARRLRVSLFQEVA